MIWTARTALSVSVGLAFALAAPAALAQDTTGTAAGTAEGTLPPPKVTAQVQTPAAAKPAAAAAAEEEVSDHEKFVGHVGVGYLGLTTLPLAPGNGIPATVSAPVVGVRYWLAEKVGLDLGLGFGLTSASTEVVAGGNSQTRDAPSIFGMAIHGGVPLVFAHQKHYKFLLVPELNVGFAKATYTPFVGPGNPRSPTRATAASTSMSARASAPRSTSGSSACPPSPSRRPSERTSVATQSRRPPSRTVARSPSRPA